MKFYSEMLDKLFDSEKELTAAEKTAKEAEAKALAEKKAKDADRKAAADEVEAARQTWLKAAEDAETLVKEAKKVYLDKLSNFCEKYGAFHSSITSSDIDDLFNALWMW